jgi:hypothetical protein
LALHSSEVVNAERTHLSVRPLSRTSEKDKNHLDPKGEKNKNVEVQNVVGDSIYSAAFSVWCNTQKVLSEGFEAIYDALERRTYAIDIVRTPGSHTHVLSGVCAALHRGANRGQTGFQALFFQILSNENTIIENKKEHQIMNILLNQSDNEDKSEIGIGNNNDNKCENKNENEIEKELGILKLPDIINFLETLKSTHLSDNVVQIFTQNDLENFGPKNDYPTHTLFGSKLISFEFHFSKSIIALSLFKLCRSLIAVILLNKNTHTNIEKLNSTANQCDLNILNVDNHGVIVNLVMDCVFTDLNAIFNSKYYYTDIENNDTNDETNNKDKNDNNNNVDDNDDSNNDDVYTDATNTNFSTNKNYEKTEKSKNLKSVLNSTFSGIFLPFLSILHTHKKSIKTMKFFLPHSIRFLDFFRQIFSPQNNGFDNENKPTDKFHGFHLHWVMKEWLEDMMKWVRRFVLILLVLIVFLLSFIQYDFKILLILLHLLP